MRKKLSSALALALILLMLVGCGSSEQPKKEVKQVRAGETISAASKWINSTIDGAIEKDTPTNIKDDFYTAANKDWLLAQTVTEEKPAIDFSTRADELLRERKLDIVMGGHDSEGGENPAEIPEAQLKHNEELLVKFGAMAADWDGRADLGAAPLQPYVAAIDRIATMEDMTAYLLNRDGMNFSFRFPVEIRVDATFTNHVVNTVIIDVNANFTLGAAEEYTHISDSGKIYMQNSNESVRLLLGRLGYPEAKIDRIIKDCYRFETRLVKAQTLVSTASDVESYMEETDNRCSFQQLKDMQGAFPLTEILTRYGFDGAESYSVTYPKYIAAVGLLYNERYLDEIKAYYMVHTLGDAMPLLDRETFDRMLEMQEGVEEAARDNKTETPDTHPETNNPMTPEEKEAEILLTHFIGPYLSEPLDQIYVARYCTAEQKQALKELIADIIAYYRVMLMAEDWLSVQARDMAVEKLDYLTVRAVYPDSFTDYSMLDLTGCDNLVEAVAAVNEFTLSHRTPLINTPVDRAAWDMAAVPTTVVNAYYMPNDNSINILAGIMADGFVFNVDDSYEETLAKVGTIVGHEITHGFDTQGYLYDKDGYYKNWWTPEDEQTFQLRASRLANYFSGFIPYPGATGYNGDNVKSEAIADMGGVKCMLGIAEGIPGFDYELFFKTYASLWAAKTTYDVEDGRVEDVHPLSFMRTNITLQQFEKFHETFDIKPGDGMYLAPENRVAVW